MLACLFACSFACLFVCLSFSLFGWLFLWLIGWATDEFNPLSTENGSQRIGSLRTNCREPSFGAILDPQWQYTHIHPATCIVFFSDSKRKEAKSKAFGPNKQHHPKVKPSALEAFYFLLLPTKSKAGKRASFYFKQFQFVLLAG